MNFEFDIFLLFWLFCRPPSFISFYPKAFGVKNKDLRDKIGKTVWVPYLIVSEDKNGINVWVPYLIVIEYQNLEDFLKSLFDSIWGWKLWGLFECPVGASVVFKYMLELALDCAESDSDKGSGKKPQETTLAKFSLIFCFLGSGPVVEEVL